MFFLSEQSLFSMTYQKTVLCLVNLYQTKLMEKVDTLLCMLYKIVLYMKLDITFVLKTLINQKIKL